MTVQLELNLDNKSPEELKLIMMQKQIDDACESMGKVRRKMFAELGEMKKICASLQQENEELKCTLKDLKSEKTEWVYGKNGFLFDIQKYQSEPMQNII